jgi:hypothetical protein
MKHFFNKMAEFMGILNKFYSPEPRETFQRNTGLNEKAEATKTDSFPLLPA